MSDGGKFTCSVVNLLGNVTKEFDVELQGEFYHPGSRLIVTVLVFAVVPTLNVPPFSFFFFTQLSAANPTGIIIGVVVAVVLVIVASGLVAYYCYRQKWMGGCNTSHFAVPTAD